MLKRIILSVPGKQLSTVIASLDSTTQNNAKLFEDALEYLITSHKINKVAIYRLVNEILGRENSSCEALKIICTNRGLFHQNIVPKQASYLLCVLYYIDNATSDTQIVFNPDKVKLWLTQQYVPINIVNKILITDIEIVKIENGQIIFNNECQPLKLSKIEKYLSSLDQLKDTGKIKRNNLSSVYSNHNSLCLGATKYFLIQIAQANKLSKTERNHLKNQYTKSLAMNNFNNMENTLRQLHSKNTINNDFIYIDTILSTSISLSEDIDKLIDLMDVNQISSLYVLIKSHNHAMGIVLIKTGILVKITGYDPQSTKLYSHITINPKSYNRDIFITLINQMPYLSTYHNNNYGLVMFCYAYEKLTHTIVKTTRSTDNIKKINPNDLLRLGLINGQHDLISLAFDNNAFYPEALIMAVDSFDVETLKLVLEKVENNHKRNILINFKHNGKTALEYAQNFKAEELVRFLKQYSCTSMH